MLGGFTIEGDVPQFESLGGRFGKHLGAAHKEHTAEAQRVEKAPVQAFLDLCRKIDHHVAADNQVKVVFKGAFEEVVIAKGDFLAQLLVDIVAVIVGFKVTAEQRGGYVCHIVGSIRAAGARAR